MTTGRVQLADWILGIRQELTEAAILQRERELAAVRGLPVLVPPFKLKELRLELDVETDTESTSAVEAKASLGIKFWVVSSAEAAGKHEQKRSSGQTQRIILTLEPIAPLHLGLEDEPELLK